MSNASWKAHFTQIISGYDPVEAQGLSELGYALRNKQIPEEEYLKWARENFELASLDMKFFQTHPAPKEIFEKLKDAYAWGPECIPVAEWEEYLLIAGLEKPTDFPPELKPIFLLAPVNGMMDYWTQFQDNEAKPISEEGESAEVSGMPEGLSLDPNPVASKAPAPPIDLSFSGIKIAAVHDEPIPKKATPQPVIETPVVAAPQAVSIDTVSVRTMPAINLENTKPEIKAQPQVLSTFTENTTALEAMIKEAFVEYKSVYAKQVYIEFDDVAKTAIAKYWPTDLVAVETPSAHSINTDSFLAIVAKTQKPYHGYVLKNEVTDRFFKEVNSGQLPENITVIPLIKSGVVIGALMGWGPKETYTLAVLREMEKVVNSLCMKLGWSATEAA